MLLLLSAEADSLCDSGQAAAANTVLPCKCVYACFAGATLLGAPPTAVHGGTNGQQVLGAEQGDVAGAGAPDVVATGGVVGAVRAVVDLEEGAGAAVLVLPWWCACSI